MTQRCTNEAGAWKFYSGSQEEPNLAAKSFSEDADEWMALKEAKEYKRCSQLYLTMELPVVENAAEDFQWTITVSFDLKSGGFVHTSQAPKSMSDECLGDIIDGKVNEYSSYYLYYYQYL